MGTDFDRDWQRLASEILTGMKEWRLQHPQASLTEIEIALDERLGRLRARMLQDAALASAAADWDSQTRETPPVCPKCGGVLQASGGLHERHLQTHGKQEIVLQRNYGVCQACDDGFFPPG